MAESLLVLGIVLWQIWKARKDEWETEKKRIDTRCKAAVSELKAEVDALAHEKVSLSNQVFHLQERVSELRRAKPEAPLRNIPLGPFALGISEPSTDPGKLSMLKRVVEDNVELRKTD